MGGFEFILSGEYEWVVIRDRVLCFPSHCHSNDYVITVVTRGNAVLERKGVMEEIPEGKGFMLPPYENHRLFSENKVCTLTLCIKKQAVHSGEMPDFFINSPPMPEKYCGILRSCISEIKKHSPAENAAPPTLAMILKKIEEHPEEKISADGLAAAACYSKYCCIRKFRSIYGLAPHSFRIQCRIRMAQKLLAEGFSAADAAQAAGFYDQSHFDRYFKRVAGLTPEGYKSAVRFIQETGYSK